MASHVINPVKCLLLDAGPIIKNDTSVSTLQSQAEDLYTVPAVVQEIRDPASVARLQQLQALGLKERSPRSASLKVVIDFARKTGDLEVLSKPDLQVLALAYELECERNHGDWRLRSVPGQKRINGVPPVSLTGLSQETAGDIPTELGKTIEPAIAETRGAWGTTLPQRENPVPEQMEEHPGTESLTLETLVQEEDNSWEDETLARNTTPASIETVTESIDQIDLEELAAAELEDSDGEGWITPSNIKKHQEKDAKFLPESQDELKLMQVATMTSDFAMQNVLLRMNLNLLSPSGQRIKHLKTWVLRCHACFAITRDMSKQFCNRCGKPTLLRTSCSTDNDGRFKVHLKKNMQWNTRGNVYSIPKPIAGSSNGKIISGGGKGGWGQELILAEDQKEYVQAMTTARRRKEKDLMDEDYLPNILSGDRGRAGSGPKVGAGTNVNSKRRNK